MSEQETLFAVVEFGVGLAGFAGVAFAVIPRDDRATVDRFRIRNLLLNALGAAFFALLPVLLDAASLPTEETWRITSGLLVVSYTAGWTFALRRARAMTAEERASMSRSVWAFNLTHSVAAMLLLAGNLAGWPFAPQFAPVLFALISALLQAAINFARIVSRIL